MRFVSLGAMLTIAAILPGYAQDHDFFEKKIRPLLAARCYVCHGEKNAMGGLRLDSKAGWQKGGNHGAVIIPGDAEASRLLRAVRYQDANLKMPPAGRLTSAEIADLTAWIVGGAPDPRTGETPPPQALDRGHWAFQPLRVRTAPTAAGSRWPATAIDSFLLAALEAKGLKPAPAADRRTLLRRVSFDLTGLPPAPEQLRDFLADTSPDAYRKVVERLLASPHYGERWGRHWLDLARFAETSGHEFDSEKPDAWRYRDYVIRAFNGDLPYDRFIREQIAGRSLGTAFFSLHEERNAADDLPEVIAEKTDNQIDVLGKTFLGLTVACARCHDHKFDPIPAADYYGLAGVMQSTRQQEVQIDDEPQLRRIEEAVARLRQRNTGRSDASAIPGVLPAAAADPMHPLYPLAVLSRPEDKPFSERLASVRRELEQASEEWTRRGDIVYADFRNGTYDGWTGSGPAFGPEPQTQQPGHQKLQGYRGGGLANSFGPGSDKLTGLLTSRSFLIEKPFLHVRMAGTVDKTRRREHGVLRFTLQAPGRPAYLNVKDEGVFEWQTTGLRVHQGVRGYFVIADRSPAGHIAVEKILFSEHKDPPKYDGPADPRVLALLRDPAIDSIGRLTTAYQNAAWVLDSLPRPATDATERAAIERDLPEANYAVVSLDDDPRDVPINLRGNPYSPGPIAPRRFLQVLSKPGERFHNGSGRGELADAIAAPDNPLTARVMVNRIWKQHFGTGLVRSVDNFGATGDRPSHPELLDWLAAEFIRSGWSVKAMHRLIVLSSAYRMDSRPSPLAEKLDPENRLLQHMPVRRLEAESIRDSMLAVAGTINPELYGPSVGPHVSAYQDGRGKPPSGPLDGEGRRSIYIQVRRNFLTPLLSAFDYPTPFTTIGNRGTTTVPAQALMLMNNEFVAQQAGKWAARIAASSVDPRERIRQMFVEAYGRGADPDEVAALSAFIDRQSAALAVPIYDIAPWTDLAHVIFNSKEFLFVR